MENIDDRDHGHGTGWMDWSRRSVGAGQSGKPQHKTSLTHFDKGSSLQLDNSPILDTATTYFDKLEIKNDIICTVFDYTQSQYHDVIVILL